MSSIIPHFDPVKAEEYLENYDFEEIREFVKLLYMRDIRGVSISDPIFLQQQEKLLPDLEEGLGPWIEKNKKRTFISFQEVVGFFGNLGLNGTRIPQLVEAVNHAFSNYQRHDGAFIASSGKINQCANTVFLRAVLALGFARRDDIRQACKEYLSFNLNREGECHVRTDGNPCAYVMVRTLRWLNEFPQEWRDRDYQTTVRNIQNYLLANDLSTADFPRRYPEPSKNWTKFGYFRSYQSSIFEAAEALVLSGIHTHPVLQKTLDVIGSYCINRVTWKPQYTRKHWPLKTLPPQRGKHVGSPWLTLRGLRITQNVAPAVSRNIP
ncbi:MAG: hypothetical protein JSV64_01485 [Candidatus Bathyarchaeota archaeon]|nr:MAG: hypothetical protein JSV64_01485 [Candidatus Bathyarchaeota archaeon]